MDKAIDSDQEQQSGLTAGSVDGGMYIYIHYWRVSQKFILGFHVPKKL